jgi:hypothetical protein
VFAAPLINALIVCVLAQPRIALGKRPQLRILRSPVDSSSRGNRHSRKRACVPWPGGGKALLPLPWSSCGSKTRESSPGGGGSVGMCA